MAGAEAWPRAVPQASADSERLVEAAEEGQRGGRGRDGQGTRLVDPEAICHCDCHTALHRAGLRAGVGSSHLKNI